VTTDFNRVPVGSSQIDVHNLGDVPFSSTLVAELVSRSARLQIKNGGNIRIEPHGVGAKGAVPGRTCQGACIIILPAGIRIHEIGFEDFP
jgi:hypothetical protein